MTTAPPVQPLGAVAAPLPGTNVGAVQVELEQAAQALDAASDELSGLTQQFEGGPDENGEWQPGPQLRYESAVDGHIAAIYEECVAHERRVPAEDVRAAMARARVEREQPDLFADYHRIRSRIEALQRWISARKASVSARQSILSAEKEVLKGAP